MGILSKTGRCAPFDITASGFTRSEAAVAILLQKDQDAKRVYARIIHCASDHDGFKPEGFSVPAAAGQIKLYSRFYKEIDLTPLDVCFIESHSTATLVGDPEEGRAIDEVFCKNRNGPLVVGSVKSNMGHGEAASALCTISKLVLTLENKLIPPNINYTKPRADVPAFVEGRLRIATETEPLSGRYVAMNSLGVGGSKVHILFEGNQKDKVNFGIPADELPRLVNWSGRSEEAINTVFNDIIKRPLDADFVALLQSSQLNTTFENTYRGYGIFKQEKEVEAATCIASDAQHFSGEKRPIVWVYTGMGSQWSGMGRDLMKIPIFAQSIDRCHKVLAPKGIDLKRILTSTETGMFDDILHSFVGIAAMQIALTDVLRTLGMEPDYIVGHSVGEHGCAYADGCLTAEETMLSSYSRGMVSNETEKIFGALAAVGMGYEDMQKIIPDEIQIACHNSSDSCTISGPAGDVAAFVAHLKSKNIFAKEVAVSNIAYHSRYIASMGPPMLKRMMKVIKNPKKRSAKWLCSSAPPEKWQSEACQYSSAEYHTNNLLNPVLFEEVCKHLPTNALTVEIAPHGLLRAILQKNFPEGVQVSLTKRGHPDGISFFLEAFGR